MVLAAPTRAWKIALVCTIASVLGGMAGYGIGMFLFEEMGRPLLEFYGYGPKFAEFKATYNEWGAWAVFIAGVTPFPYKIITITAGAFNINFPMFLLASSVSRTARFFLVSLLIWKFGEPITDFIDRYFNLLTIIFTILLVGGFLVMKLLI